MDSSPIQTCFGAMKGMVGSNLITLQLEQLVNRTIAKMDLVWWK